MTKIHLLQSTGGSSYGIIRDTEIAGMLLGMHLVKTAFILQVYLSSGVNWAKHDMGLTSDWKRYLQGKISGRLWAGVGRLRRLRDACWLWWISLEISINERIVSSEVGFMKLNELSDEQIYELQCDLFLWGWNTASFRHLPNINGLKIFRIVSLKATIRTEFTDADFHIWLAKLKHNEIILSLGTYTWMAQWNNDSNLTKMQNIIMNGD